MQKTQVRSLGWEDPLEEGMATHSSILAWRVPCQRRLASCSPQGHKESDITEQLSVSVSTSRFGECSGEEKQILVLLESFSLQPQMKARSVINRRERWAHLCDLIRFAQSDSSRNTILRLNFLYLTLHLELFFLSAHKLLPFAFQMLHSALLFRCTKMYLNSSLELDVWVVSKLISRSEIARKRKELKT